MEIALEARRIASSAVPQFNDGFVMRVQRLSDNSDRAVAISSEGQQLVRRCCVSEWELAGVGVAASRQSAAK